MYQLKTRKSNITLFFIFILFFLVYTHSGRAEASPYESYGRRDPFVPLVGISEDGSKGGVSGILTIDDVVLQGIVVGPDGSRSVIINGEVMKEGDRIERVYIESIGNNVVKIKIDEELHEIKLYE